MKALAGAVLGAAIAVGAPPAAAVYVLGNYYEDTVSGSCTLIEVHRPCTFDFAPVSGSRPILITQASCHVVLTPAVSGEDIFLRQAFLSTRTSGQINGARRVGLVAIELSTDDDGTRRLNMSDALHVIFAPTQSPVIEIVPDAEGAGVEVICMIAGVTPAPL